ncbi:MAG: hypothetical protein R2820_15140 [Cyclobacteriaceae bacterium]|nr:hypothetical protein [Cyclobacteriaceae bacterium]
MRCLIIFLIGGLIGCTTEISHQDQVRRVNQYLSLRKQKDSAFQLFVADTMKVWFESKEGRPTIRLKSNQSKGPWAAWDSVMNGRTILDSIWFDAKTQAVKTLFTETNDFYDLIGKPASVTEQSFWINHTGEIHESLIYWLPDKNISADILLQPIIEWARTHDSTEIAELYKNEEIEPSAENAVRWKALLRNYQRFKNSMKSTQ